VRFLADENCDSEVVRTLQRDGHDVLSVSDVSPRAEDAEVITLAIREKRILLTEDKDFGQLVYAHGEQGLGVIFLRYPTSARRQIAKDVIQLIKQHGEKLFGCFVTVQPGRIRISRHR
jgi:predicted nuclease of predicted toxin-antitoxin system